MQKIDYIMMSIFFAAVIFDYFASKYSRHLHLAAFILFGLFLALAILLYPRNSFVFLVALTASIINAVSSGYKYFKKDSARIDVD